MASLKALQKKVPGAEAVAGRVIAFYQGKHYDLGEYVGDGMVVLSQDGERLLNPPPEELPQKKPGKGLSFDVSLDDLEM